MENSISKKTDAEKLSVNNLNNYVKNSVSAVGSSRFNESSLKLEDETSLTDEMKALADQLKTPLQVYLYLKTISIMKHILVQEKVLSLHLTATAVTMSIRQAY